MSYAGGIILALAVLGGACSSSQPSRPVAEKAAEPTPTEPAKPQGKPFAVMSTDQGSMVIELLPDVAPVTVKRFIEMAELGFYNQTAFHRVMKDRMIQGGDPYSRDSDPFNDGQGSASVMLPQEFSKQPMERGTVAMGREEGSDNGGSCQFFIVLKRTPEWDGKYNVFGKVVEGMEVADKISNARLTKDPHPALKYHPAGKIVISSIKMEYRQ